MKDTVVSLVGAHDTRRSAFELQGVCQEKNGHSILHGIDLAIPRSRITVLLGPSGSGKTSLLRLLNRLDDPTAGTILFEGRPLGGYPVIGLRRRVAFVFQTPVMFDGTVRANLETACRVAEMDEAEFTRRVDIVAALAELDRAWLDRDGRELSLGQQQRANLARALVAGPKVLLLDEPTASLDAETARRLLATIRRLVRAEGLTVVLATHRMDEARRIGDGAIALRAGRAA